MYTNAKDKSNISKWSYKSLKRLLIIGYQNVELGQIQILWRMFFKRSLNLYYVSDNTFNFCQILVRISKKKTNMELLYIHSYIRTGIYIHMHIPLILVVFVSKLSLNENGGMSLKMFPFLSNPKGPMHSNVHSSAIYNCQVLQTALVSIQ